MATIARDHDHAGRVARVIGSVLGLALIAMGVLWALDAMTPKTTADRTFTMTPPAPQLTVDIGSGDVTLTGAAGNELEVHRTITYGWRKPEVEERSDDTGAAISAHCPSVFALSCHVRYRIAVPNGFAVDLRASSGNLDVRGISAERLRTAVSSGQTELVDVVGPVELEASSGSITATRLRSPTISSTVSSGTTTLDLATPPSVVTVLASSGDVTLRLPTHDGPYRLTVNSSSGQERVTVPTDPSSPREVTVTVSSGDVDVSPR